MKAAGYAQQAVTTHEEVVYKGSVSPIIYLPTLIYLIPGVWLLMSESQGFMFWGALLTAIGGVMLVRRLIVAVTTQYTVTSKRVILKTGMLSRKTMELLLNKIDSLAVSQGFFGLLLNYGTLTVGVATEKSSFPFLSRPVAFKKKIVEMQG
jgi:uncharacterized membrane protein YdbT with pleckstrin-like domain